MTDPTKPTDEGSWRDHANFVPLVALIKRQMKLELQDLIDGEAPCFGWLWKDESSTECPETECDLRTHCKQTWQMAQVNQSMGAKPKPAPRKPVAPVDESQPTRNKWKDSGKYARRGYQDLGRRVDVMVSAFYKKLGSPPHMPLVWHSANFSTKFSNLGDVVVSATPSYHAVLFRGVVITRFWTNSPKRAIVDIVPELIGVTKVQSERLPIMDATKPPMTLPAPIPKGSLTKSHPCTHRVIVRTHAASQLVAEAIRKRFQF